MGPTTTRSERDLLRARDDSRIFNLTLDVHDLQRQVRDLTVRRNLLLARSTIAAREALHDGHEWLLRRYFNGFKRGYLDHDHAHKAFVVSLVGKKKPCDQKVVSLFDQWREYTELFQIQRLSLKSCKRFAPRNSPSHGVVFKCVTACRGVVTRAAVDNAFPDAQCYSSVILRILGRDLRCRMVFFMHFDDKGCLSRQDVSVDFTRGIRDIADVDSDALSRLLNKRRQCGPRMPTCAAADSTFRRSLPRGRCLRDLAAGSITPQYRFSSEPSVETPMKSAVSIHLHSHRQRTVVVEQHSAETRSVGHDTRHTVAFLLSPADD